MIEDEMIFIKEIYKRTLTENEPLSCVSDGFRIESNNKSIQFFEFLIPF